MGENKEASFLQKWRSYQLLYVSEVLKGLQVLQQPRAGGQGGGQRKDLSISVKTIVQ